jgi:hypothetical protein
MFVTKRFAFGCPPAQLQSLVAATWPSPFTEAGGGHSRPPTPRRGNPKSGSSFDAASLESCDTIEAVILAVIDALGASGIHPKAVAGRPVQDFRAGPRAEVQIGRKPLPYGAISTEAADDDPPRTATPVVT